MVVALFASAFHPHIGGVEELVRQLAHAYRAKGIGVVVITNRWPQDLPEFEEFEGIPVYRFSMRLPGGNVKERAKYRLTYSATKNRMLDILKKHDTKIIHVQCASANGYYAQVAHEALKLPLIVTTQGERTMDAQQIYQRSPFMNDMLRQLLDSAQFITACSGHTLSDLENWYEKPFGTRASVVYNGIDIGSFADAKSYSHPHPFVLGIGRMVPQKGFDVLIEAFAQADVNQHHLLLAGEGSERPALERLVDKYGINDKVHFVGRANREMAVSLFHSCSFFALPSRMEPQGIVNLEAMASGKAVVASKTGGVPEIVLADTTGLLVEPEDGRALAGALTRLCNDEDLRNELGSAGQRRAREFDWATISGHYLDLYKSAA